MTTIFSNILLAALLNSAPAQFHDDSFIVGFASYQEANYTKAHDTWHRLALKGSARSQYALGVMYELGQGVGHDYNTAARWYIQAAEQGYAMARNNLAMLYESAQGVPQDFTMALKYYLLAAEQGLPSAQYNYALMHYEGAGIAQDYTIARTWLKKAAAQGFSSAQYNLGVMYHKGHGVAQDHVQAAKWFITAINTGAIRAQTGLRLLLKDKNKVVTLEKTDVYLSPDSNADVISHLDAGQHIYTLTQKGEWVAVLLHDQETLGWVDRRLLD